MQMQKLHLPSASRMSKSAAVDSMLKQRWRARRDCGWFEVETRAAPSPAPAAAASAGWAVLLLAVRRMPLCFPPTWPSLSPPQVSVLLDNELLIRWVNSSFSPVSTSLSLLRTSLFDKEEEKTRCNSIYLFNFPVDKDAAFFLGCAKCTKTFLQVSWPRIRIWAIAKMKCW